MVKLEKVTPRPIRGEVGRDAWEEIMRSTGGFGRGGSLPPCHHGQGKSWPRGADKAQGQVPTIRRRLGIPRPVPRPMRGNGLGRCSWRSLGRWRCWTCPLIHQPRQRVKMFFAETCIFSKKRRRNLSRSPAALMYQAPQPAKEGAFLPGQHSRDGDEGKKKPRLETVTETNRGNQSDQ